MMISSRFSLIRHDARLCYIVPSGTVDRGYLVCVMVYNILLFYFRYARARARVYRFLMLYLFLVKLC